MNPEPLKNRICEWKAMHKYHIWDEQLNSEKSSLYVDTIMHDIKSAVEWLKKEIIKDFHHNSESYIIIIKKINKAFEDVMEK